MRKSFLLLLVLSSLVQGEVPAQLTKQLSADDFGQRQEAEKKLIEWVREKDSEARAESLLQCFVRSSEPEESNRLAQALFVVHFELNKDEIPRTGEGFIGISMPRQQHIEGVLVSGVIPKSPAAEAGLEPFDIIVEIDGASIVEGNPQDNLKRIVSSKLPGTKLKLSVLRGVEELEIEVLLMNRAAVPEARFVDEVVEVDEEKQQEFLRQDYFQWLNAKRQEAKGIKSKEQASSQ